jgi:two-component system response regulator YesN
MNYKVFLVEDEIVTREGIRDNVDWAAAGFEFCGEAPDGEMALPLIEESKPDVLITDIKMPFMDGLQLSKIIHEHMPWVKIIILSGHDEFQYAQSAVKLGVTEYLLKPVSAQDLSNVLKSLSSTLDREKQERENLKRLQDKIAETLVLSREKFLLQLVMGGVSSADAIEQSQQLGLDIMARHYLVVFIRIELCESSRPFDYYEYHQVEQIVSQFAGNNPDVFWTQKDMEELVLLIKGDSLDQLVQEGNFLTGLIKNEVENQTTCNLVIEIGTPQNRLGDIHHSFAEAMVKSKSIPTIPKRHPLNEEPLDLIKMDHLTIENYLKFGSVQEFDDFFLTSIQPIGRAALQSSLIKHYLFVDIILTATQFVSDLGGSAHQVTSDVYEIENILIKIKSMEQIKEEMRKIFVAALTYRNSQVNHERVFILQQAKAYIDRHFANPELQMGRVAQKFNISPSYFSTIFRQELGETFRDYLGKIRINRAKELLRTTNLKCAEVAYQSGFNDSHYFSFIFKKKTGQTPQQFRAQPKDDSISDESV